MVRVERVLIISRMFPPMRGGLPDHTDRLAAVMSATHEVTVLTSVGVETGRGFRVRAEVGNWKDGRELEKRVGAAAGGGPVLWQYVPHMYGRGGVNLVVPGVMGRLARAGVRQVVIAHEIRAPYSWWPHRSVYALAHRLMWRKLRKSAAAIGISTASWLERIQEAEGGGDRYFLAPSPANVEVVALGEGRREAWRGARGWEGAVCVMGFFGSVGTGKQFDWVLEAWREARRREPGTGLVVIGGKPEPELTEDERRWFCALGYVESAGVSEAIQALDLLVLPFEDGVSERRSSFMVGLAHGVAVVTTVGEGTGRDLKAGGFFRGVAVGDGRVGFAKAAADLVMDRSGRTALGARAEAQYRRVYDWPCLARTLAMRLKDGGGKGLL